MAAGAERFAGGFGRTGRAGVGGARQFRGVAGDEFCFAGRAGKYILPYLHGCLDIISFGRLGTRDSLESRCRGGFGCGSICAAGACGRAGRQLSGPGPDPHRSAAHGAPTCRRWVNL